jgi:hypothetical protein
MDLFEPVQESERNNFQKIIKMIDKNIFPPSIKRCLTFV